MHIEKRRILNLKENKTDVIESDWGEWRILHQNKHFLIWTFIEQKLLIPNQSLITKICINPITELLNPYNINCIKKIVPLKKYCDQIINSKSVFYNLVSRPWVSTLP